MPDGHNAFIRCTALPRTMRRKWSATQPTMSPKRMGKTFWAGDGGVFIQYWLINYGICPSGWTLSGEENCWVNSNVVSVPDFPITDLANLSLHAAAQPGGQDCAVVYDNTGAGWGVCQGDSVLDISSVWDKTEFGILSTPTHVGGWIDPRVWATRLIASADSINDNDGIQSLLRLAPFGRAEARESLGGMRGAWRRLAEYALGGECAVGMTDVFRSPLWVAAGRARQPVRDLDELRMLSGVSNVPDALRESRFTLAQKADKPAGYRPRNSESTLLPLDPSFDADVAEKMHDIPQCLFYPRKPMTRFSLEWVSPWVIELKSQIWPVNPRGFSIGVSTGCCGDSKPAVPSTSQLRICRCLEAPPAICWGGRVHGTGYRLHDWRTGSPQIGRRGAHPWWD